MRFVLIILLLAFTKSALATHIVGGEMNYTYFGNRQFRIVLKLYVDCVFGQAGAIRDDEYARIGVFSKDNDSLMNGLSFMIKRKPPVRVSKTNYNCIAIPPNACIDAYDYDTIITLPEHKGGYVLSFQRCCRNNTIKNIISPQSTGENIWTFINDFDSIGNNSSPYFKQLPPNFLCTNAPLIFDHSATDADGDSLVYEFFHPYTGGTQFNPRPNVVNYESPPFSQIVYESGYGFADAINSQPKATINAKTGILKITPTLNGQFVVGIVVKEYRNGRLIGYTFRDFQFNVQECVFETTSAFTSPDINCDKQVVFNNTSQNATRFFWNFGDTSTTADTSSDKVGRYTYPFIGDYNVILIAANGNCVDTIIKTITIYDKIDFKLPNDTFLCSGASYLVKPNQFYDKTQYSWSDGSTDSVLLVSQKGLYWLKMQRINCVFTDSIYIDLDSLKISLVLDSLHCNLNDFDYIGSVQVKGAFNTINWLSEPQQFLPNSKDTIVNVLKAGKVYVSGIKTNGCSYGEVIEIPDFKKSNTIKIPNVFTPNGDFINEYFPEQNANYLYDLKIFNRWGLLMFESSNKPWDGGLAYDGVYYYFITIKDCNLQEQIHGVIHLIGD